MKSERVGLWLSLLANFGVIVGLALLVIEIRHNTLTTQAVLNQENVNFIADNMALILSDENQELASLVSRADRDPDSLSPDELSRYLTFVSMQMMAWETAFLNYDQGLISERIWRGTNAGYSRLLLRSPGRSVWWKHSRDGFDRTFQEHVDSVFAGAR